MHAFLFFPLFFLLPFSFSFYERIRVIYFSSYGETDAFDAFVHLKEDGIDENIGCKRDV
jgi:hypothetical protein